MFYNYYEDYQYDSCISKGICSIGPRTSSLQEVLIMYLKLLTFYTIELQSFGGHNKDAKKIILDTISMLMQNLEYQNEQFEKLLINIKTLIINSKKTYIKLCKDKNIEPKYIKTNIKLDSKINNINALIKQGEKEFGERNECLSQERKSLLEIMGFVIKSLCINIVELESYSKDEEIANKAFEKFAKRRRQYWRELGTFGCSGKRVNCKQWNLCRTRYQIIAFRIWKRHCGRVCLLTIWQYIPIVGEIYRRC